jgi:PAS domain S-box-containing protein
MNLGLIAVNLKDKILMVNHSFSKMSGYAEEELVGGKAGAFFLSENHQTIITVQAEKRAQGESTSYELQIKNKEGELKYWLVSVAPNYNLSGEYIGSIGIHLDITKLKKLEIQKENILKELENSNNPLQEYAPIVSYDLKFPLRSIDALVSWIKKDNKGSFDDHSLQNFVLLDNTLATMERGISNILKYSSIGSYKYKNIEDVDLNTTLIEVKNIGLIPKSISIETLNKLPVVSGDKTRFQQLFQNFLSNAMKLCDKK